MWFPTRGEDLRYSLITRSDTVPGCRIRDGGRSFGSGLSQIRSLKLFRRPIITSWVTLCKMFGTRVGQGMRTMHKLRNHLKTSFFSKKTAPGVLIQLLIAAIGLGLPLRAQEQLTLTASDGVKVYAAFYPAESNSRPYILLFHQAGSNRAEYAPIAPRLAKLGFNCLAIDQRSGGDLWGQENETVSHVGHNGEYSDALRDLEAALVWAKSSGSNRKVLVWGSSYSAALVFILAADHGQEIAGVLAFSPGEYLRGSHVVHDAAAKVSAPIFVTSAKDRDEIAAAKSILAVAPSQQKTQFIPHIAGVHGSSTLRGDKNRAGESENWKAVEEFLAHFDPKE
jgi:dienelactone hydrolase